MKLLVLLVLAVLAWLALTGRWPRFSGRAPRADDAVRARALLGLRTGASREDITAAHRRLLTQVHPDRGGSGEAAEAANAARDLLLAELAKR